MFFFFRVAVSVYLHRFLLFYVESFVAEIDAYPTDDKRACCIMSCCLMCCSVRKVRTKVALQGGLLVPFDTRRREAQCDRRTKLNWTKTAHNTRICKCMHCVCLHLRHTHTPLCGYGLSTGPTEGLSLWCSRNRSSLHSQQEGDYEKMQLSNVTRLSRSWNRAFPPSAHGCP